jgi:hypothetical protein
MRQGCFVMVLTVAVPVFPAASACVAETAYEPLADSGVVSTSVQAPPEQAAVAGTVAAPLISGRTVGESPEAVPHVPPIEVMVAVVE